MDWMIKILAYNIGINTIPRFVRLVEWADKHGLGLASGHLIEDPQDSPGLVIFIDAPDEETANKAAVEIEEHINDYFSPHYVPGIEEHQTMAIPRPRIKHYRARALGEVLGELYKEVQANG